LKQRISFIILVFSNRIFCATTVSTPEQLEKEVPMEEERLLTETLSRHSVNPDRWPLIIEHLNILKEHDEATYRHSIRVGTLAAQIGAYLDMNAKALLWAGLFHDIGKALIDNALLAKKDRFTDDDRKNMEPHVEIGFRLLMQWKNVWSAHIMKYHHRFSQHPYPQTVPRPTESFARDKEQIFMAHGRILALADYYDALMTRDNERSGKLLSPEEKRAQYLKDNADQKELILELERAGILTFATKAFPAQ